MSISPAAIRRWTAVMAPLRRYHRHRAVGLETLPAGGFLMVINHSLATYDAFMLGHAVYEATGRLPVALADDLFFRVPGLGPRARAAGLRPASPEEGRRALCEGDMVFVAPGGMREGLRPSTQRYQVRWADRRGFVRLAIAADVPVVLAACPAADDLYTVYENPLTKAIYRRFRVPVPLARGRGLTPLPRPVALTHLVDAPIQPPADGDVGAFHRQLCERMAALLTAARSL